MTLKDLLNNRFSFKMCQNCYKPVIHETTSCSICGNDDEKKFTSRGVGIADFVDKEVEYYMEELDQSEEEALNNEFPI